MLPIVLSALTWLAIGLGCLSWLGSQWQLQQGRELGHRFRLELRRRGLLLSSAFRS